MGREEGKSEFQVPGDGVRAFQAVLLMIGLWMLAQLGGWFGKISGELMPPILPAAGLAFAGCLILGVRWALPAVGLGVFFGTWMGVGDASFAGLQTVILAVGVGGGTWIFTKICGGDPGLSTLRDFFKFAISGALVVPGVMSLATLALRASGHLPPSVVRVQDAFEAQALGVLIFGTFSLFVFRRQDLRPPTLRGAYEMLFYSTVLAWCIYVMMTFSGLSEEKVLILVASSFLLTLLVAFRFGLRSLSLFLVMFVFFIPAFVAMFPERVHLAETIQVARQALRDPGLLALLGALGCLLLAAFRDELMILRVKFDLAMASAGMCVWEWSSPGWSFHTVDWCHQFGLEPHRTVKDSQLLGLLHPEDRNAFQEHFSEWVNGGDGVWEHTCRMRDKQERWVWVHSRARMLRKTADDDLAVAAGITRDVTSEREAVQARISAIENEAELKTLRSQLNPHFLFNSLNSVRALIGRDDPRARTMITSLSNLLRDLLSSRGASSHPLKRELEIVETYLQIESIRFGERLAYELDVDPAALSQLVPGMMVQTLVENAVKHGISKREQGGRVAVRVRIDPCDQSLHISVLNDGALGGPSGGFGVENTRRRLALATSGRGTLALLELPGPRVEATVIIPSDPSVQPSPQLQTNPTQ
jgi:signal transduction histidine kinase